MKILSNSKLVIGGSYIQEHLKCDIKKSQDLFLDKKSKKYSSSDIFKISGV